MNVLWGPWNWNPWTMRWERFGYSTSANAEVLK